LGPPNQNFWLSQCLQPRHFKKAI